LEVQYYLLLVTHYVDTLLHHARLLSHTLSIYQYNNQNCKLAKFDRKLSRYNLALLRDCLPIKVRAMHICLPNLKPPFLFVIPVVKFMAGKHIRRRMALHTGCDHLIIMGLIRYGLSRSIIPLEVGGDYHWQASHTEWLGNRLLAERRREEALER
jgi:hypothetical protein